MSAKDLIVKPIAAKDARRFIKATHYSGKVVNNSILHFGVFWEGRLEGAMQYGSALKKADAIKIVAGAGWNSMLELNRLAFSEKLPRNSESRAISVSIRIIKKQYPHIKFIISFADGCQCGDGAIYRAAGFSLISINKSNSLRLNPETGEIMHAMQAHHLKIDVKFRSWDKIKGNQLKYIYFIDKSCKEKLTVPILPFSKIDEMGAGMYKGIKRVKQAKPDTLGTAAGQHRPTRSNIQGADNAS